MSPRQFVYSLLQIFQHPRLVCISLPASLEILWGKLTKQHLDPLEECISNTTKSMKELSLY